MTVTEYRLPAGVAGPSSVAAGGDGAMWFGGYGSSGGPGYVIRMLPDLSRFELVPTADRSNHQLTALPGGRLAWAGIGEQGLSVVQLDLRTRVRVTAPPVDASFVGALGPDAASGGVWHGTTLVTPDGVAQTFPSAPPGEGGGIVQSPLGLADGTMIFRTELAAGTTLLRRLDRATGRVTDVARLPGRGSALTPAAIGPDGRYYLAASARDGDRTVFAVAAVDLATGATRLYPIETIGLGTNISPGLSLAIARDGGVWFSDDVAVGRLDPRTGASASYAIPSATLAGYVAGLAPGPDGSMWATEYSADLPRVIRLQPGRDRIVGDLQAVVTGGLNSVARCTATCRVRVRLLGRDPRRPDRRVRVRVAAGEGARGTAGPVRVTARFTDEARYYLSTRRRPVTFTLERRIRQAGRTRITRTAVVLRPSPSRTVARPTA